MSDEGKAVGTNREAPKVYPPSTEGREDFETVKRSLGADIVQAMAALRRIEARIQVVSAERDDWKRRYEALREEE